MPEVSGAEPAVSAKLPGEDLSAQIALAVERWPDDLVRCTRVGGSCYRCNWWSPDNRTSYDNPGMGGMMVTTHSVRMSRFLIVTKTYDGLQIRALSEDRQ
jgi:hypothetical protein